MSPTPLDRQLPRDAVEVQACDIWQRVLDVSTVHVDDNFFDLGGDSLLAVRIISEVERLFGVELILADFFAAPTVETVARIIRAGGGESSRGPLVRVQAGGAGTPLYLFHPLSGTVLEYAAFVRALGPEQQVWGLQSPGLELDEPPLTSIEAMADTYLEHMRRIHPGGIWQLAGYSLGGVIAFEVAKRLSTDGDDVGLLMLFDTRTPRPGKAPPYDEIRNNHLRGLARDVLHVEIDLDWLVDLDPAQQVQVLVERGVAAGTLPRDYEANHVSRLLEMRIHNRVVVASYHPRPYAGSIVLLRATTPSPWDDPDSDADHELGWGRFARSVLVHEVQCNHLSLMNAPNASELARVARGYLCP